MALVAASSVQGLHGECSRQSVSCLSALERGRAGDGGRRIIRKVGTGWSTCATSLCLLLTRGGGNGSRMPGIWAMAGEEDMKTVDDAEVVPKIRSGAGFGAQPVAKSSKGKRQAPASSGGGGGVNRGTVRRNPPPQPLLVSQGDQQSQQIETAFVASLAFLGGLILVEGLVLAASGLLPEDWDGFVVKYLYPTYTPTTGLFLVGAAAYGLYKYLGGFGGKK